jgi:superfamily II RNA helicase
MPADEKFVNEFDRKIKVLESLKFVEKRKLLPRGEIAKGIHTQELLSTELVFSGMLHSGTAAEDVALLSCVDYEPRRGEMPARRVPFDIEAVAEIIGRINQAEEKFTGTSHINFFTGMADLAYKWSEGAEFPELVRSSSYAEGDIVHAFRRTIDLIRQMRSANRADEILAAKLKECMQSLDRGVVEVIL